MKILFLTQYFPPEVCAPASRVAELCRYWSQAGEDITVVTTFPNHPSGQIHPEYLGKRFMQEQRDGFRVLRGWIYITANRGVFRRMLGFMSFMVSAIVMGLFKAGRADVVIATSPQILCGLAGWVVSVFKRAPFVLEVRDLWPETPIQMGVIRNPLLIALACWLEKFLYRRADLLVPVSRSIERSIRERGIPAERILFAPNGIDPELFVPQSRHNWVRQELGLEDQFLVSYIGTHGMAHGLERLLETALLLRDHPDIRFLLLGDGACKKQLMRYSEDLELTNVFFIDLRPRHEMPAWYAASDVSVVSLLNLDVFATVLPSKMFEIMACARPVLMISRGECADLLEQAGAGIANQSWDPRRLSELILTWKSDPEQCQQHGQAGRAFVLKNFSRPDIAEQYRSRLKQLV